MSAVRFSLLPYKTHSKALRQRATIVASDPSVQGPEIVAADEKGPTREPTDDPEAESIASTVTEAETSKFFINDVIFMLFHFPKNLCGLRKRLKFLF